VPTPWAPPEKGDDQSPGIRLFEASPGACDRLDVFRWEWVREYDRDPKTGQRVGKEWVEAKGKPVSCPEGINPEGLIEAAEEVAQWVQAELHARGAEPLNLRDATSLWFARLSYQNPLYELGGDQLWKQIETGASPDAAPRSICVGSNKPIRVTAFHLGRPVVEVMHGYLGCLRTFPEAPYGRGRPWARWCPSCRSRKNNAKNKAIRELRRRMASVGPS
jgi:hypothetical protein